MKIKDNVFWIFGQSFSLYFKNFKSFFRYMAFPVFGQIVGMLLILAATFFYSNNITKLVTKGGVLDNFSMIFLLLIVLLLPGFLIFIKALGDYLLAYGAINSMVDNMIKSGKVYDFHAHTELIRRKSAKFSLLWLVLAMMGIIGLFPLFWVIAIIMFVYFILVFQVFTFEPDKSVYGCFKKSVDIIKGHFLKTSALAILMGGLTYWLIPNVIQYGFDFLHITDFLAFLLEGWTKQLPLDNLNQLLVQSHTGIQLTPKMLGEGFVDSNLNYVLTCFMLPVRSICWSLWYKALNKGEVKLDKRILARAEKKA